MIVYSPFAEGGVMRKLVQVGKAVAVVAMLIGLNACASIPQRAWQNGANLSSSGAYRSMMQGDRSFRTARELYGQMDPYRSMYRVRPYQPFGRW
jgi:hypothetical protein